MVELPAGGQVPTFDTAGPADRRHSEERPMPLPRVHRHAARLLPIGVALSLLAAPALRATCGGGGGGGEGGFSESSAMGGEPRVYHVPWKVIAAGGETPAGSL